MNTNLTDEGEKVVVEANRRFTNRLLVLASFFGIANAGALFAIYLGVQSAAQATVSARMQEQIQGTVDVLQQVVSEALTELGEAREQAGSARANLEAIELRVSSLSAALSDIGPNEQKLLAAAEVLKALGTSGDLGDIVVRIDALEDSSKNVAFSAADHGAAWTPYPPRDGFQYRDFSYGKSSDGFIHLSGLMSGCPNQDTPIFTLPSEYRPESTQLLSTYSTRSYISMVLVNPAGEVFFWDTSRSRVSTEKSCDQLANNEKWLSLHGLKFHVSN